MIANARAKPCIGTVPQASIGATIGDQLTPVYVSGSAFAFAFAGFVFTAFIFAFAALTGLLLRGAGATGIADDMPRFGRAYDRAPLAFALALTALVFAAFTNLIDRRRQWPGYRFCQDRLARLRDYEGTDAHPQFRTHMNSLFANALAA